MNILSHNKGYALYPRSTFVTKKALIIETVGAGQEAGRKKYVDRGWEMVSAPSVNNGLEVGVRLVRWIGDRFTWTMPVSCTGDITRDLCPINSWQLDCNYYKTSTSWSLLKDPAFKYQYILGDPHAVSAFIASVAYVDAFKLVQTRLLTFMFCRSRSDYKANPELFLAKTLGRIRRDSDSLQ